MNHVTKQLEVYAVPSQEASIMMDVLVTNFLRHFMGKRELHSDQGQNFQSDDAYRRCYRTWILQDVDQPSAPAIGWHGGITYEGSGREAEEGHSEASERFGQETTLFMLAYRASTREIRGMTMAGMVIGR
jgi:hypothetical protein